MASDPRPGIRVHSILIGRATVANGKSSDVGETTPVDYLHIDLDHDREHIKAVEPMLAEQRADSA
jgi:hypothetical protein